MLVNYELMRYTVYAVLLKYIGKLVVEFCVECRHCPLPSLSFSLFIYTHYTVSLPFSLSYMLLLLMDTLK